MIRRPPRSTLSSSSAASDVYKRQPLDAPARAEVQTGLSSRFQSDPVGPLYGYAMEMHARTQSERWDRPDPLYDHLQGVFAKWADDGSLEQAFVASVRHLAEQQQLDLAILHGDGTNTVAKKGGDGIG